MGETSPPLIVKSAPSSSSVWVRHYYYFRQSHSAADDMSIRWTLTECKCPPLFPLVIQQEFRCNYMLYSFICVHPSFYFAIRFIISTAVACASYGRSSREHSAKRRETAGAGPCLMRHYTSAEVDGARVLDFQRHDFQHVAMTR